MPEVAKRLGLTTTTLYSYVNGDGSPKAAAGKRCSTGKGLHPAPRPRDAAKLYGPVGCGWSERLSVFATIQKGAFAEIPNTGQLPLLDVSQRGCRWSAKEGRSNDRHGVELDGIHFRTHVKPELRGISGQDEYADGIEKVALAAGSETNQWPG